MLSLTEQDEVRNFVYQELAHLHEEIASHAGSYTYLCLVGGYPTFCHSPVGRVIQSL